MWCFSCIMGKKGIFLSLRICYQGIGDVSPIIQQKLAMSQEKGVSFLASTILNNQNSNRQGSQNQPQLTPNQPFLPQNRENQVEFEEYNGLKSQQRGQPQTISGLKCQEWTLEEENLLIQLHNKKGNKWVQIARQLKRNDNSVKNHYHSKLRKALRKLNKCISDHLHGQTRLLKNNLISKIVQTAQAMYQEKGGQQKQNATVAYVLKNKVLSYAQINQQQITIQQLGQIKKIVSQIQEFDNSLKFTQKSGHKTKSGSNKYKGKEILGLLNENIKTEASNPSRRKTARLAQPLPIGSESSEQHSSQAAQQEQRNPIPPKMNAQKEIMNGFGIYGNCPTIVFLNEGIYPIQPLFYPVYQQPSSDIYSGRMSSFTSYNPQRQSITESLTQWPTCTRLQETQYTNSLSEVKRASSFQTNSLY